MKGNRVRFSLFRIQKKTLELIGNFALNETSAIIINAKKQFQSGIKFWQLPITVF